MISIVDLALQARRNAAAVVDRHVNPSQKQASLALYDVLAPCMELCERCGRDPDDRAELERLFAEQPRPGNRRYVEKASDIYVLVCRFVFTETDRTNAIRYACALREAGRRQIRSTALAEWLRRNGGVNALYFSRPLDTRIVATKTLHLHDRISFSRDAPFTLTLRWRTDNRFDVLAAVGSAADKHPNS